MNCRVLPFVLWAAACSADDGASASTTSDASTGVASTSSTSSDTTPPTTSVSDGSSSSSSTATTTTTTAGASSGGAASTGDEAPWGDIAGDCGVLSTTVLESSDPVTFGNSIDFQDLGFDYDRLTEDGQAVYDAGNLGGSSLLSEVVSFEVLARCESATLLKTEGEIDYDDPMGTKTDLLVDVGGLVVGVSVTRAFAFPPRDPYTVEQATDLLTDKLGDILASNDNVAAADAWTKHVLHVIAYEDMHAQSIAMAYAALEPGLQADTVVLVTVTDGDDAFVYD